MEPLIDQLADLDYRFESSGALPPSPPLSPAPGGDNRPENLTPKDLFKFRFGNFNPWGNKFFAYLELRRFLIDEMTGSFVGAMPVETFLRTFMNYRAGMESTIPDTYNFSEISGVDGENAMYQTICDAINNSGLCPGFKAIIVANESDKHGIRLRPDLAVLDEDQSEEKASAYDNMEFWMEIKAGEGSDGFDNLKDANTVEKNKGDGSATRGQLISYAAAVLSRQHRLHLFSILICGTRARFFRWDRTGCTLSASFSIHDEPKWLAYFLWCYSRLTRVERGFDPTVKPASPSEAESLRKAVEKYKADCKKQNRKNVTALRELKEPEPEWPAYRIKVEVNRGGVRNFIIGRPFWGSDSATGRATRGYLAYDTFWKRLFFLKDSWRTESTCIPPEGKIYENLREHNVPFLPIVIAAGDVKVDGRPQKTVTQRYANNKFPPAWRAPCTPLDTLIHYRIVQELAYPLISAVSSKEVVHALRDIVHAIKIAYQSGKILHRDISLGNVMISKTGRGCLNDWDHALDLSLKGTRHAFRTGTWQFISGSLLSNPSKRHEIHDDLESCFWVLLNVSLHYFEHEKVSFSLDIFNEYVAPQSDQPATGGYQKKDFFAEKRLDSAKWKCVPLNNLIHELATIFREYLGTAQFRDMLQQQYQQKYRELEKVDVILQCFDRALASDQWPREPDAVKDQFEPKSSKQASQDRLDKITRSIANTTEKKSAHTMSTRTKQKRSTEEAGLGEPQAQKRARTRNQAQRNDRMPPPPLPPTLSLPVLPHAAEPTSAAPPTADGHRMHNTRATVRARAKAKEVHLAEDVEMQEAEAGHRYGTRSKSRSNEAKRRQNLDQGVGKANTTKPPPVKRATKVNKAQAKKTVRRAPKSTKADIKQTEHSKASSSKRKPWR